MKVPYLVLGCAVFVCLLTGVHLSNPDSELVQDDADGDKGDNVQKPASPQDYEIQKPASTQELDVQKSAALEESDVRQARTYAEIQDIYSRIPGVRILRPFMTDTGIVWRDVGLSGLSEGLNRMRDRSILYSIYKSVRGDGLTENNRPTSLSPDRPQRPWNNDRRNNASGTDRNVPIRTATPYAGNGQGVRNGNFPPIAQIPSQPPIPEGNASVNNGANSNGTSPPADQTFRMGYLPPINYPRPSGQRQGPSPNRPSYQSPSRGTAPSPTRGGTAPGPSRGGTLPDVRRAGTPPGAAPPTGGQRISPDSNLFASIVNNFAFKLVEAMNIESNFVISPLSIFIALSMLYLGSDGQTKMQLEQALGLNENSVHGEHLHRGIRELMDITNRANSGREFQLFVANGMFLGQNFTVERNFQEDLQILYAAELKNVDFSKPDLSTSAINNWVSENTNGTIRNLLDRPPRPLTRLLLLNAVYFKGLWKTRFPAELTYSGRFRTLDGNDKQVPTMAIYGETFPMYRSDEQRHTFIKLPYAGDQVSMVIALPYGEGDRPTPLVRGQTLCYILDAMRDMQLNSVSIPRFRLEDTIRSLRRPLMQLGISDIFNSQTVDLKRLRRQNDLLVSAILHKAVVEVNEEGTTAAGVTGVRFVPLSIRNSADFVADHPFTFYIVHEPTGLVLFYGKIYDVGENAAGGNGRQYAPTRPRPNSEAAGVDSGNATSSSRVRLHGAVTYDNRK